MSSETFCTSTDKLYSDLEVVSRLDDYLILRYKDSQIYRLGHKTCKQLMSIPRDRCYGCGEDVPEDVKVAADLMPKEAPEDKIFRFAKMYGSTIGRLPGRTTRLKGIK